MSEARVIYTPRADATSESEAAALAAVYRFLLDCRAKKTSGVASTSSDGDMKLADKERRLA